MSIFHRLNQAKKDKKKAQEKKNRFHQELFNSLRLRRAEEARVQSLTPARPKSGAQKTEMHSDKVARIRSRITGKQRVSKERWNRFSGTGGEGGRGL